MLQDLFRDRDVNFRDTYKVLSYLTIFHLPFFCRGYNFLAESSAVGSKEIAEEPSFRPSTKVELQTAVNAWISNQENAIDL